MEEDTGRRVVSLPVSLQYHCVKKDVKEWVELHPVQYFSEDTTFNYTWYGNENYTLPNPKIIAIPESNMEKAI